MCICWNDTVSFSLVSFSQNHICEDVVSRGEVQWRFIGIYGWPEEANKHHTWELVRSLCENSIFLILNYIHVFFINLELYLF